MLSSSLQYCLTPNVIVVVVIIIIIIIITTMVLLFYLIIVSLSSSGYRCHVHVMNVVSVEAFQSPCTIFACSLSSQRTHLYCS
mmetsp:Transcript_418/g.926  ORF Transcript_418/g.926 Transcript_418/m.926 type:complete len:83 (+) Transcript_418:166-414(+)